MTDDKRIQDAAAEFGAIGGRIRAQRLSKEERSAIAASAANARWLRRDGLPDLDALPKAIRQGPLRIGDVVVDAYVLEGGRRVLHKRGLARALGLKSDGGNAFMKTISRRGLGSAISTDLRERLANPIIFKPLSGDPGHGYDGEVLIEVCEAISEAGRQNKLAASQTFLAVQADIITRASTRVGIRGLIDEATGYISDKRKDEYQELFNDFLRKEFRQWEKEFPDKFFDMLYRIYGLKRHNIAKFRHPTFFSKFIRKYIYHPLAISHGAILKELDKRNPAVYANGGRRYKMHQFLTDEIGLPAFRQHLWQVVGIGLGATDKAGFDRAFNRAFPTTGTQFDLDLGSDPDPIV
jgi:hypothetical protein